MAVAGAVLATFALAAPASAFRRHDVRLDTADAAIEKAMALLDEAESDLQSRRLQRVFDHHIRIAQLALEVARNQIEAAGDVADSETQ
jgi:hypothetical protein